jgi:glycerol-3-phosphate dehydrogenase
VLSTFAGLRPLVAQAGKSTSQLSREHLIDLSPSGLISVIGGKWTTYRQMGEDVVDLAAQRAELPRRVSITATLALDGPTKTSRLSSVRSPSRENGRESASATEHPADEHVNNNMHREFEITEAEIDHAVNHQWARTVDDVLARRSRALFLNASAAISVAPLVARRMARLLGHDRTWEETQVTSFERLAAGYQVERPQL